MPGKGRRAVRLYFNTYYEDTAKRIIEALRNALPLKVNVERSKVVPELYYVDIEAGEENLEELRERVEKLVREAADDTVFGVKVYVVDANR